MSKVSILIPMYNSEKCIRRCLDSIMRQTFQDYEVIMVDDGSTDKTSLIAKEYVKSDIRFKLFYQSNKGVASARNNCLQHASGEYILFIDSDDWIENNMLERMLGSFREDVSIVFCHHDKATIPENRAQKGEGIEEELNQKEQIREFLKHKKITGMLWNKLIRSNLFDSVTFDEKIGYGEDAQGLWQVLQNSQLMIIIPDILYHHTDNPDSISEQKYSRTRFMANVMWSELAEQVKAKYPEYYQLVQERLVATATYTRFEMIKAGYNDNEEKKYIRRIVRENFGIVKNSGLSTKMKLFAAMTYLGF